VERWCIHIIVENNYRGGPFAAAIRRFKGMVSTMEIEPDLSSEGLASGNTAYCFDRPLHI
jgi:hypothetical protein